MLVEVFNVTFNFCMISRKLKCFFPFEGMHPNSYRTASSMNTFNNKLSLYIPRVTPECADVALMTAKFAELEIGEVRRIDFVEKISANGYPYFQAFVHFESWNDCQTTRNMQERIADPNRQCRIVYNDPWYWVLLKNNNPLSDTEYRLEQRIIDLEQQVAEQGTTIAQMETHLQHIAQMDAGAEWMEDHPIEDHVSSLEGLAQHTRMTVDELVLEDENMPNAEEQAWLNEQIDLAEDQRLQQEMMMECDCCSDCSSETDSDMPSLIDGEDEDWLPEDSEDEESDDDEDDEDDVFDKLEAAIEQGHVITRQASDGGPDRKRARMGPIYQVGEICHDENGTAYVWTGHSWSQVDGGPVPMDVDSDDEQDVDALAAQFGQMQISDPYNASSSPKSRHAFSNMMCDNC